MAGVEARKVLIPLHLELPMTGEQIAVELMPGDCALFGGCVLPHCRRESCGERFASLFIRYADEEFLLPFF
jgi:hypothetical protein